LKTKIIGIVSLVFGFIAGIIFTGLVINISFCEMMVSCSETQKSSSIVWNDYLVGIQKPSSKGFR
jgi:hypothetical protein